MPSLPRFFCLLAVLSTAPLVPAQENPPAANPASAAAPADAGGDEKPPTDRIRIRPRPNVIDLLLAAEGELAESMGLRSEAAWAPIYKKLYNDNAITLSEDFLKSKDAVRLSFALGMRASDGVVALKARDIAALNACATDIQKLATQLNVPDRCIQRANRVKQHANDSRWIEAFAELGRLQHEVMQYLDGADVEGGPGPAESRKDDALLIIMGGWQEGGRIFTQLVLEHYTDATSNILREPKLLQIFIEEVNELKPAYKEHPLVAELLRSLPEFQRKVNVGLRDPVPKPDVEWMHKKFQSMVSATVSLDSAAAPQPSPASEAADGAKVSPGGAAAGQKSATPSSTATATPNPAPTTPPQANAVPPASAPPTPSTSKPDQPKTAALAATPTPKTEEIGEATGREGSGKSWWIYAIPVVLAAGVVAFKAFKGKPSGG